MSFHTPDGALEIMRRGFSICSCNIFSYADLNLELDFLICQKSNFLESEGWPALPIPGRNSPIGARPKVDVPVIQSPSPEEIFQQLWEQREGRLRLWFLSILRRPSGRPIAAVG
ncbi:MAG: hypothetical protein LBT47_05790 [Deltaproteobacteria bacterium]|nr:hypothetical protein [Deltaproteobacteria bacterium]